MKKTELFLSFLLVPVDFMMIVLAAISAYNLRFSAITTGIRPVIFNLDFSSYLNLVLLLSFFWVIIFAFAGLYSIKSHRRLVKEFYRIVLACSTGFMLIVTLIFFRRELFDSRFIVLVGWILSIIYIFSARATIRLIQKILFSYGIGVHRVILVGNSVTTENLIREFSIHKNLGYTIVRRLRDFSLETEQSISELIKMNQVDEIIQSDPNLSKVETLRIYDFADENHLSFKYAADLLGAKVLRTEVNEIAGIPIVEVIKTPLEGWGRIVKRIFDIVFSFVFIIFLSPIFIITALIIKLDSRGPIIYKNDRVDKNRIFKLYKFRSYLPQYCVGDEYGKEEALNYEKQLINEKNTKNGPLYKIANDPRITRFGRFIRKWSIDELPQLFNVFLGTMSLVGPRPHQPREVAKYEKHHKKVMTVKPGATGLAQISGRSDLSFEEEVKLDIYYIENWSILLDLSILLRTPLAIIKPRKAE